MSRLATSQIQRLSQKLSPQQIQMIKLLELPSVLLEQRIKQEIEENPVLDIDEASTSTKDDEFAQADSSHAKVTIDDFVKREETPSYRLNINNYSADDKHSVIPLSDGLSLSEHLSEQLSYQGLSDYDLAIGNFIIGSLDSDGYLRRDLQSISDDLAFNVGIDASCDEIERLLKIIQTFEPVGICARDLREALLLQLDSHEQTSDVRLAKDILTNHFDDFAKRHFDKIISRMGVENSDFKDAVTIITSLSPKPANLYNENKQSEPTIQITPDFILDNSNDELEITLNKSNLPPMRINSSYVRMLEDMSAASKRGRSPEHKSNRQASQFIRQKIESARWFMSAIKQRNATMLLTMNAIVDFQQDYFKDGDETKLRPMILKDIAEATALDVSTISRVVNSKYIQTPFGIFLLKYFFSEAMHTDTGEEVSSREIKSILREYVDNEDKHKPLTDEALMLILNDRGYQIARRTVAKYREMLDIPVSRLRREI